MNFTVHCARPVRSFRHFWQSTGFTPATDLLYADVQQALDYFGSVPHGGITHCRIHYLLDLIRGEGFDMPRPRYDWSRLDAGLDVLQRNGLKPFFELMGNPSGWFSDFTNPRQHRAWRQLVRDTARRCLARYGRAEVRSWYWETWNEPDIGWWHQWPKKKPFLAYYDACVAGLRDADPALVFGGPGTTNCHGALPPLLKATLRHGGKLDFISTHLKGSLWHREDIAPSTKLVMDQTIEIADYIKKNHPQLAGRPFINNECDPIIGWKDIHTWHARAYYAAWVARLLALHQREVIGRHGINYALLSNDHGFLGAWGNRTMLTRFMDEKQRDLGQFELIKKPIFNLMALLSLLGDEELPVAGLGELYADAGLLATRRGRDQVALLVYNVHDKTHISGSAEVQIHLDGLRGGDWFVAHYRIDDLHPNVFDEWAQGGLQDERKLTARHVAALRARQEPVRVVDGLRFTLPLPGMSLLLLTRRPTRGPGKVTGLTTRHYFGLTNQGRVMLRWDNLPGRVVRTFEVLHSESPRGSYRLVKRPDDICNGYLHVQNRPVARGWYKVRAVDYWGRAGTESSPVEVE